jgi:hypothetical protein
MKDPFFNSGGEVVTGPSSAVVHKVNISQMKAEQAVSAYKRNVAIPGVHIADRDIPFEAKEVGEDGQEMTFERRQELMKGKPPMIDEDGQMRDHDYRDEFEIETEELGETTQRELEAEGYRVVQARELEVSPEIDIDMIEAAKGAPLIHRIEKVNCVYTTGGSVITDIHRLKHYILEAFNRVAHETGCVATVILMSDTVLSIVKRWCEDDGTRFDGKSLWGCRIEIFKEANECIRVVCDDPELDHPVFASLFVDVDIYRAEVSEEETGEYPAFED